MAGGKRLSKTRIEITMRDGSRESDVNVQRRRGVGDICSRNFQVSEVAPARRQDRQGNTSTDWSRWPLVDSAFNLTFLHFAIATSSHPATHVVTGHHHINGCFRRFESFGSRLEFKAVDSIH